MIGLQVNAQQLNTMVGQTAVNLRNACQAAANLQEFIVAQGTSGLTSAPISMSAQDAASIQAICSYMSTVAGVFFGTATQGSDFDFDSALAGVYGGQ